MNYLFRCRIVLFQCEWFNTDSSRTMCLEPHLTTVDVRSQWYKDDSFVLPSQVQQVFYVYDTKLGTNWRVVEKFQHRGIWDVPERDELEPNDAEDIHVRDDAFQLDEANRIAPIVAENSSTPLSRSGVEIIQNEAILDSITRALNEGIVDDVNMYDDGDDDQLMDESENEADNKILSDYDTDVDLES